MRKLHFHVYIDKELLCDTNTSIHIHLGTDGRSSYSGSGKFEDGKSGGWGGYGSGQMSMLTAEQRIRPKFYELSLVPEAKAGKADRYEPFRRETIKMELSSGNQRNPVWESFAPEKVRGLWRFTVRQDYQRMVGVLTFARDSSALWVISEWTPKGSLVLEPVRPGVDPKVMLFPLSSRAAK